MVAVNSCTPATENQVRECTLCKRSIAENVIPARLLPWGYFPDEPVPEARKLALRPLLFCSVACIARWSVELLASLNVRNG